MKIILTSEESVLDQFFVEMQEGRKTTLSLLLNIQLEKLKKADQIDLKLTCEATNLLK